MWLVLDVMMLSALMTRSAPVGAISLCGSLSVYVALSIDGCSLSMVLSYQLARSPDWFTPHHDSLSWCGALHEGGSLPGCGALLR